MQFHISDVQECVKLIHGDGTQETSAARNDLDQI